MDAFEYLPAIEDTDLKRSPKTGYWEIRWSVPAHLTGTGRARSRTYSCRTKDHNLAVKIRREFLNTASAAQRAATTQTIEALCQLYEADHVSLHGVKPTQMESLKAVRKVLGSLEPGNLTARELSHYRAVRANGSTTPPLRKVKPGTVRRELGALRAVLNWAQREGHLPREFVQPHIALPPEGQARVVTLSAGDEAKLHARANRIVRYGATMAPGGVWRASLLVVIALNTAARAESIESLTWDRVDMKAKLIDFRDPTRRATKKRRVPVPISDRLFRTLARVWIAQGKPRVGPVLGTFGSTRKGFEALRKVALPGQDFTRHDLRRTWATLAAQRGVPLFHIANVLGDTLETTEKHYAHHSPDYLRDAINKRA